MSFAAKEKYAVSAPAIIADMSSSIRMAIISIVALDASIDDAWSNSEVRFVSPSVLSKMRFSLVKESKLTKGEI